MKTQRGFIFKVVMVSLALSFLIKYGGRLLPIAPSSFNAIVAILTPTLIVLTILIIKVNKDQQTGLNLGKEEDRF